MKFQLAPSFHTQYKKLNVRIKKSFKKRIKIFEKNQNDPILDNHSLKRELTSFRSIDIWGNKYVAVYEEIIEGEEPLAYFVQIGLKDDLYKKKEKSQA